MSTDHIIMPIIILPALLSIHFINAMRWCFTSVLILCRICSCCLLVNIRSKAYGARHLYVPRLYLLGDSEETIIQAPHAEAHEEERRALEFLSQNKVRLKVCDQTSLNSVATSGVLGDNTALQMERSRHKGTPPRNGPPNSSHNRKYGFERYVELFRLRNAYVLIEIY